MWGCDEGEARGEAEGDARGEAIEARLEARLPATQRWRQISSMVSRSEGCSWSSPSIISRTGAGSEGSMRYCRSSTAQSRKGG